MKGSMVLLGTVEEQHAAGIEIIDPAGINVGDGTATLFYGFSYRVPEDVAGSVTNMRVEDGRLVGDVDVPAFDFGVAGTVMKDRYSLGGHHLIEAMDLLSVGLTTRPARRA